MTKKEITTLIGVIAKVKDIAERDYDGKIYDNILTIFNKLQTIEKRVLLKGLINICFVVEDKVLVSTEDLLEVKNTVNETKDKIENVQSVEQDNKIALASQIINLKTLIVKSFILFILAIILGILLLAPSNGVLASAVDSLSAVFNFILG